MKLHPFAAAAVAALALAVPATASAEGGFNPTNIGLEVQKVDGGSVTGRAHCVPPELAGRVISLNVAPGVDVSALTPGALVGVTLDQSKKITQVQPSPPCSVQPSGDQGPQPGDGPKPGDFPQPQPGQQGGAGPGVKNGAQGGQGPQGDGPPRLLGAFTSRVWKFTGDVDGFSDGKLSMTLGKILNLPKRFAAQDDDLLDQDAIVLVGAGVRVIDENGKRTTAAALDDADSVRVQGKLLPPKKWQEDEDGQPVTTIRAKRVYITG
jgi:hypothetical protein